MSTTMYANLKKRAEAINKKRIEVRKELEMLRAEQDTVVAELKELGIENVQNLPGMIAELEQTLETQEAELDKQIATIEQQLGV